MGQARLSVRGTWGSAGRGAKGAQTTAWWRPEWAPHGVGLGQAGDWGEPEGPMLGRIIRWWRGSRCW